MLGLSRTVVVLGAMGATHVASSVEGCGMTGCDGDGTGGNGEV